MLRSYNLNFPSIGYHNMRENEYLSMAQEMQRTNDFFARRLYFGSVFGETNAKKFFQLPLVSYQILITWQLFGQNLWSPRLFNIIFGLLGIILLYHISFLLSQDRRLALISSGLLAIMPLGVFFSRNLQPESPALFLMLLATVFYFTFLSSSKRYYLVFGGLAIILAWLYEPRFLIGIIPILFCLPLKFLFRGRRQRFGVVAFFTPYLLIIVYFLWLIVKGYRGFDYQFMPFEIFKPAYWANHGTIILWLIGGENYTLIYSLLASFGMCLALFRNKTSLDRYIIGWALGIIVYGILFPRELYQNGYAQMPFLALVCIACAYATLFIAEEIRKWFLALDSYLRRTILVHFPASQHNLTLREFFLYRILMRALKAMRYIRKNALIILVVVIICISIEPVYASLFRMHGTIFLGQDVAGESLRELSEPGEHIFLFTHTQGYAIARYASRYVIWSSVLERFKEQEKQYAIRFLCLYPGEYLEFLKRETPALFEYIETNYHVKEVGFTDAPVRLVYLILERGDSKSRKIDEVLQSLSGRTETRAVYKVRGVYIFLYAIRPTQS